MFFMLNYVSFIRIVKTGLVNFWRNAWLSAAATLIMVITLIILSSLLLLFGITSSSVTSIKERVDISAYFKNGLADDQILSIKKELEADPKISAVNYTSAQEALDQFRAKHQNDPLITETLNELDANPLPASLQIKAQNLEDYPAIAEALKSERYQNAVDKVNFEDNRAIIERLNRILKFIISFGIGLVTVFALIAVVVISNTITLTIHNRREEVEIMRLVGATNSYIRGPFVMEALIYSVLATLVTTALLVPVYANLIPKISSYLNPGSSSFTHGLYGLPALIFLQLGVSIILSVGSSLFAIRKYLKI